MYKSLYNFEQIYYTNIASKNKNAAAFAVALRLFKKWWQEFPLIHVGDELPHLVKCCEVSILIIKVVTSNADCKTKSRNKI